MPRRIQHALRFAVATAVAVYAIGMAWELVDVFVRGDVADGLSAAGTVSFNEGVWRVIAGIEAVVVFLLRLGDLNAKPPSWPFAFSLAAWLGVSSVAVATAVEEGELYLAALALAVSIVVWIAMHRMLPGWPPNAKRMRERPTSVADAPEQDLP